MLVSRSRNSLAALAFVAAAVFAAPSLAAQMLSLDFITHAAFFSAETKQPSPLDPQAFVADAGAGAAVGPQGIAHAAGFRPASLERDPATAPIFAADGRALGFDLGAWLGARGSVSITEKDGAPMLSATFSGLRPGGVYSLFENHFDQKPVGFTPIDGVGAANTFTAGADGSASLTTPLTHTPTHANAILLVYHSDGQAHGVDRGRVGVDAHHQLIARPQ